MYVSLYVYRWYLCLNIDMKAKGHSRLLTVLNSSIFISYFIFSLNHNNTGKTGVPPTAFLRHHGHIITSPFQCMYLPPCLLVLVLVLILILILGKHKMQHSPVVSEWMNECKHFVFICLFLSFDLNLSPFFPLTVLPLEHVSRIGHWNHLARK